MYVPMSFLNLYDVFKNFWYVHMYVDIKLQLKQSYFQARVKILGLKAARVAAQFAPDVSAPFPVCQPFLHLKDVAWQAQAKGVAED